MGPKCIRTSIRAQGTALCWGAAGVQWCSHSLQLTAGLCVNLVPVPNQCDIWKVQLSYSMWECTLLKYYMWHGSGMLWHCRDQATCLQRMGGRTICLSFLLQVVMGNICLTTTIPLKWRGERREGRSKRSSVQDSTPGSKLLLAGPQCWSASAVCKAAWGSGSAIQPHNSAIFLSSCAFHHVRNLHHPWSDTSGPFWEDAAVSSQKDEGCVLDFSLHIG